MNTPLLQDFKDKMKLCFKNLPKEVREKLWKFHCDADSESMVHEAYRQGYEDGYRIRCEEME